MVSAIIVAAGKGIRMHDKIRKQYLWLGDCPILNYTLRVFASCNLIDKIFLVVDREDFDFCHKNILSALKPQKKVILVGLGSLPFFLLMIFMLAENVFHSFMMPDFGQITISNRFSINTFFFIQSKKDKRKKWSNDIAVLVLVKQNHDDF